MTRHHRDLRLPAFPRPYPAKRGLPPRPRAADPESLRPLLWMVLLLQGLTLLLLVVGPSPKPRHQVQHPGLTMLDLPWSASTGIAAGASGGRP